MLLSIAKITPLTKFKTMLQVHQDFRLVLGALSEPKLTLVLILTSIKT